MDDEGAHHGSQTENCETGTDPDGVRTAAGSDCTATILLLYDQGLADLISTNNIWTPL